MASFNGCQRCAVYNSVVTMNANIRRANIRDLNGAIECEVSILKSLYGILPQIYVDESISYLKSLAAKRDFESKILDSSYVFLVAEKAGEIVGIARGFLEKGGVGWLSFIGVKPSHRKKGIGTALLRRFIDELSGLGAHKISLYTSPVLIDAVKLYARLGFIPEGFLRKHFYGIDLIHYSLFLYSQ